MKKFFYKIGRALIAVLLITKIELKLKLSYLIITTKTGSTKHTFVFINSGNINNLQTINLPNRVTINEVNKLLLTQNAPSNQHQRRQYFVYDSHQSVLECFPYLNKLLFHHDLHQ